MATTDNLSLETVQAYRVLCEFCSLVLCESPSDEVLDRLIEQRALMLEQPFSAVAPAAASQLHDVLARAASEEGAAVKTALRRDYAYLFYMVGSSGTSPFESVYRTDDRTMFGPTTLEVREAYRAWGVQVPGQGSVPDDHRGRGCRRVRGRVGRGAAGARRRAGAAGRPRARVRARVPGQREDTREGAGVPRGCRARGGFHRILGREFGGSRVRNHRRSGVSAGRTPIMTGISRAHGA